VKCLEARIKDWLAPDHVASNEEEFCVAEKTAWMEYMRLHVPVEYANLKRIDLMNF
jgi:hypothetical protein